MKIGIGIDTGGTYTDAVAYDFDSGKILGSAKSLTTKENLTKGILGALDGLPGALLQKAELISLSTTLATNACVEDKGGYAKLIFFGGDARVIDEMGGKYGLPKSSEMYLQESYTKFSGETEREVDWDVFSKNLEHGFEDCDGIAIVEMNAVRNGASAEKKAKRLVSEKFQVPVVCGHELFSELNSLQRSSSTLLNARLFPVIKEFLNAIKKAMEERNIHAPVVIVRSDGSMMSEEFASLRPVETLLCGPAASAIGGTRSTEERSAIIVDMGGTTTDIALVKEGTPVTVVDGVSIGKWKTFVDGLYVKTFGLGGDTAIHYQGKALYLEDYRVVPMCVAAQQYPSVLDYLKKLAGHPQKHTMFLYEHYMLMRDIEDKNRYTKEEKAFCAALKDGPLAIREAAQAIGKDMYNINVSRLIKEGVVQLCGLTPTDIMHIRGDFTAYSAEASRLCAQFAAHNMETTVEELCARVYTEIKRKLYRNIAVVLLENKYPHYMKKGVGKDVLEFIDECFENAQCGKKDDMLSASFQTEYALVGIGAPIKIFMEDVARALGTKAVVPDHYEVANALGAVTGNVSASCNVEVRPNYSTEGITGYTVYSSGDCRVFKEAEEAMDYAVEEAIQGARDEALRRGAKGEIAVTHSLRANNAPTQRGTLYLGTMVTARAVGAMGF